MMKKFLAVSALIVLIFCTCAEAAYYDNDGDSWESAYVIASSEDLMLLRDRVNSGTERSGKYYILSGDIDLTSVTWRSIGNGNSFTGHFDGQGHTIRLNDCLFDFINAGENATAVRNLNLSGNISGDNMSGLAFQLDAGIIENCTFTGSITRTTDTAASTAGLVARLMGGTIRYCAVSADITSRYSAGGIAGDVSSGTIENCTVEAGTALKASGNAGGIAAYMSAGTTAKDCTVKAGAIITASNDAGGIVGTLREGTINNCSVDNGADITAQRYTGGISGYSENKAVFSGNAYPSDYVMTGNIPYWNGNNDGSSWEKAYILMTSTDLYVMRERVEAGSEDAGKYYKLSADIDFSVKKRQHIRGNYWGESFTGHLDGQNHTVNLDTDESLFYVISSDEGTTAVKNLKLTGAVNVDIYSNSALAWQLNSGIIENCSFTGKISSSNSYSSGLIAVMRGGIIQGCTVSADISNSYSNGSSGGIVGRLTAGTIESCRVKAGTIITASQDAGGIAGYAETETAKGTIKDCTVETGTVITASIYSGGIVGFNSGHAVILSGNVYPSNYHEIGNFNNPYHDRGSNGSSWENAYVIESYEDFILMRDRVNAGSDDKGKYYRLSADIDLTTENWQQIRIFTGHFDGQNHTITISADESLFGEISSDIDTIALRNLNVAGRIIDANVSVGGIAWKLTSGIIENCSFTGLISSDQYKAGGFIGWMNGGTVRNCTVSADISSLSSESGGIAGSMSGGSIENCAISAETVITALGDAGGIVGSIHNGSIENCTVEDGVSISGSRTGGIAGYELGGVLSGNKWPSAYTESGSGGGSTNTVPDSPVSGDSGNTSDNTQITWNNHTYQVYNENTTWEEAKSRCEALGGHLVTITSTLEQEQIENLLRQSRTDYQSYWIGASADVKGFWDWVTDEVFERQYANFAQGQPDGSGNYLCIYWNIYGAAYGGNITVDTVSNSGKWDDTTNNGSDTGITSHGYICEWDDEPGIIEEAPAASDFQAWQADPENYGRDSDSGLPAGANPSPVDTSHLSQNPPNAEMISLPVSFDARQKNSLPPVRNQGIFNTCWAFAALGAMEADYMTQGFSSLGTSPDLSELHLAWFTYKDPSSDTFISNRGRNILMEGGDPDKAVPFLNKAVSPVNEEEMPYTAAGISKDTANQNVISFLDGRTADSFRKSAISLSDVNNIGSISSRYRNDTETTSSIKRHIIEHGAVYFRFLNDASGYNDDMTSFYSEGGTDYHAALIVGWDDNYPASNFRNNPQTNGAWLVRTSRWINEDKETVNVGDNEYGCFWMSYAQARTEGGITEIRSFSVNEERVNVVENGSSIHTNDITSAWGARIFRAGRNERLIRVSFHTTDNNAKYQLFVNRFGKKIPTDPGRAENPLSEGEIACAGYHTVTLSSPVDLYDGDYYAVIIKMTMFMSSNYRYPTAVEASTDKYIEVSVNEGESFFAEGAEVPSVWQDGKNVDGGPYNACIMTFTEERITYETKPSIITASLPSATVSEPYSFALSSSGTQKIEWRSGNIPENFALSREGLLTGNPTTAGQYDVNITAVNDVGYIEKTLALTVNSGEPSDPVSEPENDTPSDPVKEPENNTSSDDKPAEDTPPDNDPVSPDKVPENEQVTGVGGSNGGCNSGVCVFGAALLVLLVSGKKRG